MLSKLTNYWKAGAAFAGGISALWTLIAADDAISFDEIGYVKSTLVGLFVAFVTAVSPKNTGG